MNTKRIRKLATVAAAAALALQLFAGASSAAVPQGESVGGSYDFGGDGDAGFWSELHYADSSTLAKLYLKIEITNGSSVPYIAISKNDQALNTSNTCSTVTGAKIECLLKTVRNGDDFRIEFSVDPLTDANVTATGGWSSTGYVLGDNSSHGDAWEIASSVTEDNELVALFDDNADHASGFGNTTLTTETSNNKQAAKLTGLPSGKFASVDDNAGPDGFGFSAISLVVNDGLAADFDLVITYPKNTQAPKSYLHVASAGFPDTEYFLCKRGEPQQDCFTWDKKKYEATLYLSHNGSVRRGS